MFSSTVRCLLGISSRQAGAQPRHLSGRAMTAFSVAFQNLTHLKGIHCGACERQYHTSGKLPPKFFME